MKIKLWLFILTVLILLGSIGFWKFQKQPGPVAFTIGQAIDSLNGVKVYYNGSVSNLSGRNLTPDHYNLGLKFQCVEFVKRYYYEYLNHKMPNSYGDAKDFFDAAVVDGAFNKKRGLKQFRNPGGSKPKADDLLIFAGNAFNKYGHVAIISGVDDDAIEIIQQNPGATAPSRKKFGLKRQGDKWFINNDQILGWLRKA